MGSEMCIRDRTGKRFLKSNKVLNLNAPFTKFTDENEDYAFQFEL